jgi:DNA-binding MarR family transcriptional regulator
MDGKQTFISLTDEGDKVYHQFRVSLKEFFNSYSSVLGSEFSKDLSKTLHEASNKLERDL